MKFTTTLKRTALVALMTTGFSNGAHAADQFWNTNGTQASWTSANWGASGAGPFTNAWTSGNTARFTANSLLTGATATVAGVVVDPAVNARFATVSGTFGTGGTVATIDVGAGGVFDMGTQAISATAGTGFIKNGDGIWKSGAGSAYNGGFTLNAGTVVLAGINGMGNGVLNINGGTIAANANRSIINISAINVGGDFTMGAITTGVASGDATAAATISMTAPVNLGGATRTISLGAGTTASYTFSGAVSNGGLIVDGGAGATSRIILNNNNSTFAGGSTINAGGTISTHGGNSTGIGLGVTSGPIGTGDLTINGGRYIPSSSGSNTIGNNIILTNTGVNSIVAGGTTTLAGNITGAGGFRKGSGGAIILTGTNDYAGVTNVQDGIVAFANRNAFYNGNTSLWNDTNLVVGDTTTTNTATAMFVVGAGPTDFTEAEWYALAALGTATGGFLDLGSIGIDTTNYGGDFTIASPFVNTNGGLNRLGLAKSGTNNLILTAANTHGGPTTAVGGTLTIANPLAVQNSTLTNTAAGTIVFDQAAGTSFTLGGLAGAGTLGLFNNANQPIALTIGGNNLDATYSGTMTSVANGSSITKVGTGTQTLSGANVFDGGLIVNSGKLNINHALATGSGPLTINGGTIDNTSTGNITIGATGSPLVVQYVIPVNINGDFTFAGSRALNLGTGAVTLGANVQLSMPALGQLIPPPGTPLSSNNTAITFGGVIGDGGNAYGITTSGIGRVFFANANNTFSGGVTINGGVVHINELSSNIGGGVGPLGTGTVTMNNGQLILASTGTTINQLENNFVLNGAAAANFITSNGTSTLTANITGTGGFWKSGNAGSSITLLGTNTYAGGTIIGSGAVNVNGSHIGGGDYSVTGSGGAAILNVNGTINSNGNLDIDIGNVNVAATGSLTVNDTVNSAGTGVLSIAAGGTMLSNNLRADTVALNGTATIRANGGAGGASNVESFTIDAAAKLNLKDNDLVVGTAANVDAVRTAIIAGKTNNAASGITSDVAAFGTTTGFGYAMGNDAAISPLLGGFLTGQGYDTDSVLVKYTFLGDADLDGDSDLNDLGLWAQAFTGDLGNPANPATYWTSGDFDYDGDTDLNDLGFWAGTFTGDLGGGAGSLFVVAPGAPAGAVAALNSMGITVVPEPSTFMLAGIGLAGLAIAARRKKSK